MKVMQVKYQAAKAASGLVVNMDVYKPDNTIDAGQSVVMTEVGTTGEYYAAFNADAPDWYVKCRDANGGAAIKHFDKSLYDTHGIAALVADVQTAMDNVAAAIGTLQTLTETVDGKMDIVGSNVGDLLTNVAILATGLGVIEGKIDDLGSSAMVG